MRILTRSLALALAGTLAACTLEGEQVTCTMELRFNACVTNRGSNTLPAGYTYVRQRLHDGDTLRDTLGTGGFAGSTCFPEADQRQRVIALAKDSVKAVTPWVKAKTVDGCHSEPVTMDLTL